MQRARVILMISSSCFNDTATTEIYTLSLHDALPIYSCRRRPARARKTPIDFQHRRTAAIDRKSTRLNSSDLVMSYAVFCLKKNRGVSLMHAHGEPVTTGDAEIDMLDGR